MLSGFFAALAGIVLVAYSGQATLGLGDPFLFQSIAAAVIGGVAILGGRGHYLGAVAGAISLIALISLLQAENMPRLRAQHPLRRRVYSSSCSSSDERSGHRTPAAHKSDR